MLSERASVSKIGFRETLMDNAPPCRRNPGEKGKGGTDLALEELTEAEKAHLAVSAEKGRPNLLKGFAPTPIPFTVPCPTLPSSRTLTQRQRISSSTLSSSLTPAPTLSVLLVQEWEESFIEELGLSDADLPERYLATKKLAEGGETALMA